MKGRKDTQIPFCFFFGTETGVTAVSSLAKAPSHPIHFHDIMGQIGKWDNIWMGNGKDNSRLWTTLTLSYSPQNGRWVVTAILNHVWNF